MTPARWWERKPRIRTKQSIEKRLRELGLTEGQIRQHLQDIQTAGRHEEENRVVNVLPRRVHWRNRSGVSRGNAHEQADGPIEHPGIIRHQDGERWWAYTDKGRLGLFDTKREAVLAQLKARDS